MPDGHRLPGRYDIYGPIHKGLRHALSTLLIRLGNADHEDRHASAALIGDLRDQLSLSAGHLAHEEAHIHDALERQVSGGAARLDAQHADHLARFAELDTLIAVLEAAPAGARAAAGHALYLAFSLFAGEDFAHMHEEETVTRPLLCALFTDAEQQAMEMAILASLTPEKTMAYMRIMLPAMTAAERLVLLAGMKAAAPAEALAAVMQHAARPTLPARDFSELALGLGLAA